MLASNPTPRSCDDCRVSCRRWQEEWQRGHVVNATHIAGLQDISGDVVPSQIAGCTACNIALYCHSGVRSKQAADKLASLGFTGGLYDGQGIVQWQQAGYNLVDTPSRDDPGCAQASGTCSWQLASDPPSPPPPSTPSPPPPSTPTRDMTSKWITIGIPAGVGIGLGGKRQEPPQHSGCHAPPGVQRLSRWACQPYTRRQQAASKYNARSLPLCRPGLGLGLLLVLLFLAWRVRRVRWSHRIYDS